MTPTPIEEQARVILRHIITEDEKLQAAKDVENEDQSKWNRSRLAVRLLDNDEVVSELSKTAVRRAVADLYGVSDLTVQRGEKAARLFTPKLVAEHPLLTFTYWRTAADANHYADNLEAALDIVWQIEHEAERYGRRPSIRTVESWVYRDDNERIKTVWRSRTDGITAQMEKVYHDPFCPQDLRYLVGYVRAMLLSYLSTGVSPLQAGVRPLTDGQFKPPQPANIRPNGKEVNPLRK